MADRLLMTIAGQQAEFGIYIFDNACSIGDYNTYRTLLNSPRKLADLLLHGVAFRDIYESAHQSGRFAIFIKERSFGDDDHTYRAVSTQQRRFIGLLDGRTDTLAIHLFMFRCIIRRDQVMCGLAKDILFRTPQKNLKSAVAADVASQTILVVNRIGEGIDNLLQETILLIEHLLYLLGLGKILEGFHRADHHSGTVFDRRGLEKKIMPAGSGKAIPSFCLKGSFDETRRSIVIVKFGKSLIGVVKNDIGQGGTFFAVESFPVPIRALHVAGFESGQLFQGLIPVDNAMAGIQDEDRSGRICNQALDKTHFLVQLVLPVVNFFDHGVEAAGQQADLILGVDADQAIFTLL